MDVSLQLNHTALPSPEPQGSLASNISSPYNLSATDTYIVLGGLSPNTNYSLTLCAFTDTGCGSLATSISQTDEDGEG